jgi:hypothetical protein
MKQSITFAACCTLFLLLRAASFADTASVREQQVKMVRGYVAALHSKDKAKIIAFFHPSVRACINDKNRSFLDYIVAQQLDGFPSGNYSKLTITPVLPKSAPTVWTFVPAKGFPYPVLPTYDIQIDFYSQPTTYFSDMLEAAPSGNSWYLVTACPNADGMRFMREMQARQDKQTAQGKKLAAALHGPLLAKIKQLLAKHDRIGAIDAYQKATGSDTPTAASVIDAIEHSKN